VVNPVTPLPPRGDPAEGDAMQVLVRSNDPVRLSFLLALLRDAGIDADLLDQQMSVVEGSIGAIQRRLVVADDDASRARRVLQEAGEAWT
jgi:hypothetical protein